MSMFIVMGGTGHVGASVAGTLLGRGQDVTIITRHAKRAERLRAQGAVIAEADVEDVAALRAVFRRGSRAFLLNPPADPSTDTDAVERHTVATILEALDGSGLEKVVAESTYGAQSGERIGDLSVLWDLEVGLGDQQIPAAINRAAYYMSNWDALLDAARAGSLPTMMPADLTVPMVAPADLGVAAADRLMSSVDDVGMLYVEGPARYSPRDVAKEFERALGAPVRVEVTPRDQWVQAFRDQGFSERAAESYARMTGTSVDGGFEMPNGPRRGATSLRTYVSSLVADVA